MAEIDLGERLRLDYSTFTPAGRKIAAYLAANLNQLPFMTADEIADRTGLAGITVGRFLRRIGYRNLDELKQSLRDRQPWLMTDRLDSFRAHASQDNALEQSLQLEKKAIEHSYSLTRTPEFGRVVEHIADAEAVYLAGIQSTRGIVNALFCHLEYIRPRVYYVDGLSGTYVETLNSELAAPYLLVADLSAYAAMTRKLVEAACRRGIAMALVCDRFCAWARDYPVHLLQIETDVGQFWDSLAPMCCLFNLIVNGAVARLGSKVDARLERNRALQLELGQFEM